MGNRSSKKLLSALAAMLGVAGGVPATSTSPILQQPGAVSRSPAAIPRAARRRPVLTRHAREVPKTPRAVAAELRAGDKRRAKQVRRAHNRKLKRAKDRMTWRVARDLAGRWTDRRGEVRW